MKGLGSKSQDFFVSVDQVDKKRAWEMMCREKPDVVKDRETERALQRISTRCVKLFLFNVLRNLKPDIPFLIPTCTFLFRGVVQLFNAVRKHQKTIDIKVKEVGGSERKKAKLLSSVSKKDFIDVLRTEGGSRVTGKTEKDTVSSVMSYVLFVLLRCCFILQNGSILSIQSF